MSGRPWISERVASERCERIGDTVGYSIRLESKQSSNTRMLFCTTGILLRRLQSDPDLRGVSHVIVDEVHERDLLSDFLLVILRRLAARRQDPPFRLVAMAGGEGILGPGGAYHVTFSSHTCMYVYRDSV